MSNLKVLNLTIKDNVYVVKFPNNAAFIAILREKQRLAGGRYESISQMGDIDSLTGKFSIDMIAHFNINVPSLIKDLNCDSLEELDMMVTQELLNVYVKKYLPWWNDCMQTISGATSEKKEEDKKDKNKEEEDKK